MYWGAKNSYFVPWNECLRRLKTILPLYNFAAICRGFEERENSTITFAEISTTYSARRDQGLGICVISEKNLVLEIFWVKTQKIDIFPSNFRRFDHTQYRKQLET